MGLDRKVSKESIFLFGLLLACFVAQLITLFTFSGTIDSGDSIQHYLLSRYAPQHPELFLDHWGKPFFSLLSSIPASFGFKGMQLFNCLMALWTMANVYWIARRLLPSLAWAAPLLLVFMPGMMRSQFSGLTEPLMAAWLSWALLLMLREKRWQGALVASLLPFIRTEGFLLLPVFAFYLLEGMGREHLKEKGRSLFQPAFLKKAIPTLALLAAGTVVYSLVGGIAKGDLTWVFTENPYENLDNYGKGDWGHFPQQLVFVIGVPVYGLWALGVLTGLFAVVSKWMQINFPTRFQPALEHGATWRLILGLFLVYFIAHMIFWATGVAHSMGLKRVLVALTPLVALTALRGLALIGWAPPRKNLQWILSGLVIAYVAIFPWTANPAGIKARSFQLSPDQEILETFVDAYREVNAKGLPTYYANPYAAMAFDIDPWSYDHYMNSLHLRDLPEGSLIVWDSWFSVKESGVPEHYWAEHPDKFELWKEDTRPNWRGEEIKVKLYLAL